MADYVVNLARNEDQVGVCVILSCVTGNAYALGTHAGGFKSVRLSSIYQFLFIFFFLSSTRWTGKLLLADISTLLQYFLPQMLQIFLQLGKFHFLWSIIPLITLFFGVILVSRYHVRIVIPIFLYTLYFIAMRIWRDLRNGALKLLPRGQQPCLSG